MKTYTEKETIIKFESEFEKKGISLLYTSDIINWGGKTSDTKRKYTEVITKKILENIDFKKIKKITRTQSYNMNHDGTIENEKSNRKEEIIAKKMYNKTYDELGEIIDYQIPLKDKSDSKTGKIDIISKKEDLLYLIELKNEESEETLIRCVLEIITYFYTLDHEKLKKDFNLKNETVIIPSVLIFEGTRPREDLEDIFIKKIIKEHGVQIFIAKKEEPYEIKKYICI